MCGIYCSIATEGIIPSSNQTQQLLESRGPNSAQKVSISVKSLTLQASEVNEVHVYVFATVLALRGDSIKPQPLLHEPTQSFLCWNGEAWKEMGQVIAGNDSEHIFNLLLCACKDATDNCGPTFVRALTSIAGPFAFVFYDAGSRRLFYGRDPLGRRSLLSRASPGGGITLCSITGDSDTSEWKEVEADGVHSINLLDPLLTREHWPWPSCRPQINRELPQGAITTLGTSSMAVLKCEQRLNSSLRLRIADILRLGPVAVEGRTAEDATIAILFSGGLDCTLLARLAHDLLPLDEPIDLLNVAFENPRSLSAASKLNKGISIYESCPDRLTGRSSYLELLGVCGQREWRFIAIDVPYTESQGHRDTIVRLMAPHNTEMDLSISKALYFAARGQGRISHSPPEEDRPFTTKARVLLSGLGADELFGGYIRHATACVRSGYKALIDELDLDIQRLGQRNLGRDDRVISHWGKEVRYPYLDEDFMGWALSLPVWQKCGFVPVGQVLSIEQDQIEPPLDPAKQILRLLAWRLRMPRVANEKKRAIQFGSRTAKMHAGKGRSKGTDLVV